MIPWRISLAIYAPLPSDLEWTQILDIIDGADALLKIDCIRLDRLQDLLVIKDAILTQGIKLYECLSNFRKTLCSLNKGK